MGSRLRLGAVLLSVAFGAACASTGPEPSAPLDPVVVEAADRILDELFPRSCRMVHKLNLRAGGRESVLTGHMVVRRDTELQALAVDEFGGPVFTFASSGTEAAVKLAPAQIRRDILLRGPVRDLELVFMLPPSAPVAAFQDGGRSSLRWQAEDGFLECDLDLSAGQLLGCAQWQGRRRLRELSYEYVAAGQPGAGRLAWVRVRNHQLHYEMDIEILQVVPK